MSDLLISTDSAIDDEWSPTLSTPVHNGTMQQRFVVANETKATIIEWRLWKSFTAGGSLVLSRDTGPGLKYYNIPMYTRYFETDTILFASPYTPGAPPYDLDGPKATALVVNVTGDVRVYPKKALDTTNDFTIVNQGGVNVGIFAELRSTVCPLIPSNFLFSPLRFTCLQWFGALILPPGSNISVDYDSASVASSLMYDRPKPRQCFLNLT
jgi:hypothetical protein